MDGDEVEVTYSTRFPHKLDKRPPLTLNEKHRFAHSVPLFCCFTYGRYGCARCVINYDLFSSNLLHPKVSSQLRSQPRLQTGQSCPVPGYEVMVDAIYERRRFAETDGLREVRVRARESE